jgi:predicted HTH domain antitoxin
MTTVHIPIDDRLLATVGLEPSAAAAEFRFLLAVKLFELRRLTFGQAAEMADMNHWDFTAALGRTGVSPINLTSADLADDLARA